MRVKRKHWRGDTTMTVTQAVQVIAANAARVSGELESLRDDLSVCTRLLGALIARMPEELQLEVLNDVDCSAQWIKEVDND